MTKYLRKKQLHKIINNIIGVNWNSLDLLFQHVWDTPRQNFKVSGFLPEAQVNSDRNQNLVVCLSSGFMISVKMSLIFFRHWQPILKFWIFKTCHPTVFWVRLLFLNLILCISGCSYRNNHNNPLVLLLNFSWKSSAKGIGFFLFYAVPKFKHS